MYQSYHTVFVISIRLTMTQVILFNYPVESAGFPTFIENQHLCLSWYQLG